MNKKANLSLNAYLFRQASLCPLKLDYLAREASRTDNAPDIRYKSESRIMLRRALGMLHPNGMETDENYEIAIRQTRAWLEEPDAVIYGGLIAWKNCRARLPVLIREDNRLTLLQLHGKLWKPRHTTLQLHSLKNRKLMEYVREAAYKKWILGKLYPDLNVIIRLYFPNPGFRSETDNLYDSIASGNAKKEDLESFFIKVDADLTVNAVLNGLPSDTIHPFFRDKSIREQFDWIGNQFNGFFSEAPFIITNVCKLCRFRNSTVKDRSGCWESHLEENYKYPDRHVFDLPGYGNDLEASKGNFLQEEVGLPAGISGFQDIYRLSGTTISIQQRRALQILLSKEIELPLHWLKKGLTNKINQIAFPLHFIDFEAATSAIPMEMHASPYKPILFQFSCHTLHRDGSLDHHQWLDTDEQGFPHEEFVHRLAEVPDIGRGIIVQYSPFEKQALNSLKIDFEKTRPYNDFLCLRIRELIDGSDQLKDGRFLDMNRLVRDFYFNREMRYGLGLKQVLFSTLKTSDYLKNMYGKPVSLGENLIYLIKKENGDLVNPYKIIQDKYETIDEGSTAMHAWLYTKTPYCTEKNRLRIHSALRRYCSLDSLALVIIFQQWLHLSGNYAADEDILIWE